MSDTFHTPQELLGGVITWPTYRRTENLSEINIDENEIDVEAQLGCGSSGIVYSAVYQGSEVAVKSLMVDHDLQSVTDFIQVSKEPPTAHR
jgi:hypothetical protein